MVTIECHVLFINVNIRKYVCKYELMELYARGYTHALWLPVEEVKHLKYHSFRWLSLLEAPIFPSYFLRIIPTNNKNYALMKI